MADEHWVDSFESEDLKSNEALRGYETPEALAQAHVELANRASQPWTANLPEELQTDENLEILKEYETPEAAASAILKMKQESGSEFTIPDSAEAYELPINEDDEAGKELDAVIRPLFAKYKVPQEFVTELSKAVDEFGQSINEAQMAQAQAKVDEGLKQLQKEWPGYNSVGHKVFDVNMETANMTLSRICKDLNIDLETDPDAVDVKTNPLLARVFHWVGTRMSEGSFSGGAGILPAEDKTVADELKDAGFSETI